MPWLLLLLAGLCEIGWAVGLKYSQGFTRVAPTVGTVLLMLLSFVLLAQAYRAIPMGTAYAVWTGIGAAGTAILGILLFGEPATLGRVISLLFIVMGIMGLRALNG